MCVCISKRRCYRNLWLRNDRGAKSHGYFTILTRCITNYYNLSPLKTKESLYANVTTDRRKIACAYARRRNARRLDAKNRINILDASILSVTHIDSVKVRRGFSLSLSFLGRSITSTLEIVNNRTIGILECEKTKRRKSPGERASLNIHVPIYMSTIEPAPNGSRARRGNLCIN